MLPFEDAVARVLGLVQPLAIEHVSVDEAVGRALAERVVASRTLPPSNTSSMDGYAVRAADCPGSLRVVEKIFAGQRPTVTLGPGECARIMTGAATPPGADAVVMQEKTAAGSESQVEVLEPVTPGVNIRNQGEDTTRGDTLFEIGRGVGLAEAGLLWAQGLSQVSVFGRPRVAIASSGDELCAVGDLAPGDRLVDTNSPVLAHAARRAGAQVTLLGLSPDRLDVLTGTLAKGLSHDVLLAVAGASVGERDFTGEALRALGVEISFWKVAMKPGKPLLVGRKGSTLVFGLPGNPVSAMVTFELFVRPVLRALQGLPSAPEHLSARLETAFNKPPGLRWFVRARAVFRDGELWARPLTSQSSGALSSVSGATHLITLGPEVTQRAQGEKVDLISLAWGA